MVFFGIRNLIFRDVAFYFPRYDLSFVHDEQNVVWIVSSSDRSAIKSLDHLTFHRIKQIIQKVPNYFISIFISVVCLFLQRCSLMGSSSLDTIFYIG